MDSLSGRKLESGASASWIAAQPGKACPDLSSEPNGFSHGLPSFHAYQNLIRYPSRVFNDCFYRFMEWLPLHPLVWALIFGVGLLVPLGLFGDNLAPINHSRSFTELHASYFFLPVIVVQILIMPLFFRATLECFDSMRPAMSCSDESFACYRNSIIKPGSKFQQCVFVAILLLCILIEELSSLRISRFIYGNWNRFDIWLAFANMATLAMFIWYLVMPLSRVILLAKYLGRTLSPRLFDDNLARPIVVFGIRAGMFFAIPYFFVASTAPIFLSDIWTVVLPGVAGALTAIGFSLIPAIPIHRSIRKLKREEVQIINSDIEGIFQRSDGKTLSVAEKSELVTLLDYKREVKAISEWPFKAKFIRGFGLYFLLFPLTWVAAAFVEMIVERMAS
jgi:hypothetical protein